MRMLISPFNHIRVPGVNMTESTRHSLIRPDLKIDQGSHCPDRPRLQLQMRCHSQNSIIFEYRPLYFRHHVHPSADDVGAKQLARSHRAETKHIQLSRTTFSCFISISPNHRRKVQLHSQNHDIVSRTSTNLFFCMAVTYIFDISTVVNSVITSLSLL